MSELWQFHTEWVGVAGSPYATVIHIEPTIGSTPQQCADAWLDFLTAIDGAVSDDVTYTLLNEVTVIESTTGELVDVASITGGTVDGLNTNQILPRTTQMLVQWQTGAVVAGRRRRGRTFLPCFTEDQNIDPGVPSGTIVAGVAAAANAFVDACGGAFVIYSTAHRSFSPVTAASVWSEWASLRSRRD